MILYIAIALFVVWISFMLFVQFKGGLWTGRKFGDRIADHLSMDRKLFHAILANGVNGPSLQLLAVLEKTGLSPEEASIQVAPSLERGLSSLEARFGQQPQMEAMKPKVAALVADFLEFQRKQESRAQS